MTSTTQLTLLEPPESILGVARDGQSNHGEVLTRRWVVRSILDLDGASEHVDVVDSERA